MDTTNKIEIMQLLTYVKNIKQMFLSDEKLNCLQIELLSYLLENENQTVSELADKLNTSPASTSTIVDRLVKKGLVVRTYTASDRRKVYVSLTEIGAKEINRLMNKKNELITASLSSLTLKEKEIFGKLNDLFKKLNS